MTLLMIFCGVMIGLAINFIIFHQKAQEKK